MIALEAETQQGVTNIKQLAPLLDFHEKLPPSNRVWIKTEAGKLCHLMNRNQWKISRRTHPPMFLPYPEFGRSCLNLC